MFRQNLKGKSMKCHDFSDLNLNDLEMAFFFNLKLFYYIKTNKQHITTIQHKHNTRHIKKKQQKNTQIHPRH